MIRMKNYPSGVLLEISDSVKSSRHFLFFAAGNEGCAIKVAQLINDIFALFAIRASPLSLSRALPFQKARALNYLDFYSRINEEFMI